MSKTSKTQSNRLLEACPVSVRRSKREWQKRSEPSSDTVSRPSRTSLIFRLVATRKRPLKEEQKRIGLMTCTLFRSRFITSNVNLHSIIAIPAYRNPTCRIFQILIRRSSLKQHSHAKKKGNNPKLTGVTGTVITRGREKVDR